MCVELFHKIMDEIATIPSIDSIKLHGLCEPLLDKRLEDFISYAKAKAAVSVGIYTNGLLLTPERHDSLRAAGLDSLVISLNAVSPEQHEAIMGMKGKFGTVCANADYAIKHNKKVQVHAVYTTDTFTEADMRTFYARWGDVRKTGNGLVIRDANWGGDMKIPPKSAGLIFGNMCCHRAINHVYITYDGIVTTCCMDPFGKQRFGDLKTQTLRDVYNGEPYVSFRVAHAQNRADQYEICKNCTRI
jgi:MoaA/NifB/PqqE/SkfB family radical SAM enzyme